MTSHNLAATASTLSHNNSSPTLTHSSTADAHYVRRDHYRNRVPCNLANASLSLQLPSQRKARHLPHKNRVRPGCTGILVEHRDSNKGKAQHASSSMQLTLPTSFDPSNDLSSRLEEPILIHDIVRLSPSLESYAHSVLALESFLRSRESTQRRDTQALHAQHCHQRAPLHHRLRSRYRTGSRSTWREP